MSDKSRYGNLFSKEDPFIEVHNMEKTSEFDPPDGFESWKEWWEKEKNKRFGKCSNKTCDSKAEDGAHVQEKSGNENSYIVPLCKPCNQISSNKTFLVKKDDMVLIKCNEQEDKYHKMN